MKSNGMLALFNHLIREPAFNQLRTEEQLGYIVHTSVKTSGDHIKGLLLLIQSDSFNPNHVEERIEIFLTNYRQKLVDMSESDFQTHVDAMVASFLEKVRDFILVVLSSFAGRRQRL
jgi:insulysin